MTMTFRPVVAGTPDVSVIVRIVDATTGLPETGVAFNTSGIDIRYRRDGGTDTAITEASLSALDDAHTDGGFLHIGNGYYRVDLPDAACAVSSTGVLVHGTVTDMVVIGCYVPLVAVNPYDAVRMGMTALPNAAAAASGGLFTRGTGAGQINQSADGQIDVNVAALDSGVLPFFAVHASGTLSGTHSSTTADLGTNAPSTDITGMTLYIPSRGFVRVVESYNTGTGVATFESTSATLTNADPWYLFATPAASSSFLNDIADAILTRQMTESYAADGVAPTLAQALLLIQQSIGDFSVSGTTLTVNQLDGSTAAATYTLDSATAPTSRTRAT